MKPALETVDKNVVDVSHRRKQRFAAFKEFRHRLSTVGSGKNAHEIELLASYAKNQKSTAFVLPALIVLVAATAAFWDGVQLPVFWAIGSIAISSFSTYLCRKYLKSDNKKASARKWRLGFIASLALMGISWSLFAAYECRTCSNPEFLTLQFSAILLFQAVIATLCYHISASVLVAASAPTFLLATKLMLMQHPLTMVMSVIVLGSLLFFYLLAIRFKHSVMDMLELATDKEILILELETARADSEGARVRAEESNFAKSRFLATMSHELRTPLNAILGFSEMMRGEVMGPIDNKHYKGYVNDIHSSGSHLLKLINEILDLSRIEAGKQELNEEHVSLVKTVDEARHMMEVKARQKGVTLQTVYEERMPSVWIDARAIRQVALNLLSNALKFTPSGGTITLKAGWTARGGQYFSVIDTGPGIPEEEIPIVLSSFGQGSIAIKDAEPGTGLGLSIVQALLHMHQGRFDLRSKLREGTEVIALLPLERVATENHVLSQQKRQAG